MGAGDTSEIDVFLDDIPYGRDLGGFEYDLNFDDTRLHITAQNHNMLLMAAAGSGPVIDLSETVPDVDGSHAVVMADFGTAENNPSYAQGVLGRYTLHAPVGVVPGLASLTLTSVLVADEGGLELPIATVRGATVAVGTPCDEWPPDM